MVVDVISAVAWPATALVILAKLHQPIGELLRAIGQRATKFSVFKVEIELGKLTQAGPGLRTTLGALKKQVVSESGAERIVAGVTGSGAAEYVLVALRADGASEDTEWLTSRLFLTAAILERNRVVRCMVFTGERNAFLGAATPRDVRAALGARYPEYEQALFGAYASATVGLDLDSFRGGQRHRAAHVRLSGRPGVRLWRTPYVRNSGISNSLCDDGIRHSEIERGASLAFSP